MTAILWQALAGYALASGVWSAVLLLMVALGEVSRALGYIDDTDPEE